MAQIDLVVPAEARRWQAALAERLRGGGHEVRIVCAGLADTWPALTAGLLALESRVSPGGEGLWKPAELASDDAPPQSAALRIDLGGRMTDENAAPVLSLRFDGHASASAAATAIAAGRLPEIEALRNGRLVARAKPMLDGRILVASGLDDVLARAISLMTAAVQREFAGDLEHMTGEPESGTPPRLRSVAGAIAFRRGPSLLAECARRLRYRACHWKVGYRFHDGQGVADTGLLAGPEWSVLPDDGLRYYADPFAFEWRGRHFLFVEEYPHLTGKGVISVAEFDGQRRPSVPRVVLEQPFHLSYPQVFQIAGETWMLPEGGAGGKLVLYRAEAFPDEWKPHAVLIEGRELYDATLLEHGGRYWLLASERDGAGSSSDMLVVFHSPRLEGPWQAHEANPILIDRAAARPGGAFVRVGRRIVYPVQDGTSGYGGGLGLADIVRLDEEKVEISQPVRILGARNWPYPKIHTLNRSGNLEVIDGIAPQARRVSTAKGAA